jgi:hypothetical protein
MPHQFVSEVAECSKLPPQETYSSRHMIKQLGEIESRSSEIVAAICVPNKIYFIPDGIILCLLLTKNGVSHSQGTVLLPKFHENIFTFSNWT